MALLAESESMSCVRWGAGLAGALMLGLMAAVAPPAHANALASASLDIVSLIWKLDDGDGDRSDDLALTMVVDSNAGQLQEVDVTESVSLLTEPQGTQTRVRAQRTVSDFDPEGAATPVDIGRPADAHRLCRNGTGAECSPYPYPNNTFDVASMPSVASVTQQYSYADQYLENATFGFAVNDSNNVPIAPAGATIQLRAESADTTNPASLGMNADSQLTVISAISSVRATRPMRTYLELTYSYFAIAALDDSVGRAEATLNISILLSGSGLQGGRAVAFAPLTGSPGSSQIAVTAADPTVVLNPTTVYSPDIVFANTNSVSLSLVMSATAFTQALPIPVPVPPSLALLALGLAIAAALGGRASARTPSASP